MSSKFLASGSSNTNLTNGTAQLSIESLSITGLSSSMPVKTNSVADLVSSKLDISDINDLQSVLDNTLQNPYSGTLEATDFKTATVASFNDTVANIISNPFNGNLTANSFIKLNGTGQQYLMADGSVLTNSGTPGSNTTIYLYNNANTVYTPPPANGTIRYNSDVQELATKVYVSHLTSDNIDIEQFYNNINELSDVYIQDKNNSVNFIRYNITGDLIIIANSYVEIPVAVVQSGGTGASTFGSGHNIFLAFLSNLTEIDTRLTALEDKTTNIAGEINNTNFTGLINSMTFGTKNNDYSSVMIGFGAGTTQPLSTSNILIGQNTGAAFVGNCSRNVGIGDGACYRESGSDNIHIGHLAGIGTTGSQNIHIGSYSGYYNQNTGNDNMTIGYNSSIGGLTLTNSMAIGNNSVATSSNAIVLGNSSHTTCSLGSNTAAFVGIFKAPNGFTNEFLMADGSKNNTTFTPISFFTSAISTINSVSLSATLFYNGINLNTTNSTTIPITALTGVGGTAVQVGQATTTTFTKIMKTQLPTSSTASYQDSGLLGTSTFLINGQSLYVGMGWHIKITFGVADIPAHTNSRAGMFVGLVNTTSISWAAGLLPNTLPSCVGIGHDPGEANIAFYDRGTASGTKEVTAFNTTTPDTRWFQLLMLNRCNSNDITMTLTDIISGMVETRTITAGTATSQLSNTTRLYPCVQRIMGNPSITSTGITYFGSLTVSMLT